MAVGQTPATDRGIGWADEHRRVIDHRNAVIDATRSCARHRNPVIDDRLKSIAGRILAHR